MQSLVVAPGVFLSQSITVFASTGGTSGKLSAGAMDLRFFANDASGDCAPAFGSSVAFRFLVGFGMGVATVAITGLPVGLLAAGLVARLGGPPLYSALKGLLPGLPFDLFLGTLGLVARFATTEWPPSPGATGEVAREPVADGSFDRESVLDGVWDPDREVVCDDCDCTAGSFVGAGGSSTSSSSSSYREYKEKVYVS